MATEWISRDHVIAALKMTSVLEHYEIEAGRGSTFRIHCPFHDDERPSCSINTTDKVFNCFGCPEHGTVFDFIAGMEGLDPETEFRAVLEMAVTIIGHNPTPQRRKAKRSGSSRSEARGKAKRAPRSTQTAKAKVSGGEELTCDGNADPVSPSDGESEDYSSRRSSQLRGNMRAKTKRGGSPSSNADGSLDLEPNRILEAPAFPLKLEEKHPWLTSRLERIGLRRSFASRLGVGYEARSNALMAGRICFPIHNSDGELVAYAGRWASDEADEKGRYIGRNGKEQPRYRLPNGFHKQLELYNWHRVLASWANEGGAPVEQRVVVLVEGFWSVLRLWSEGIPAVALMGLSIADAQIRLLSEGGTCSVLVVMDGDDEGRAAAETIVSRLAPFFFTRCLELPDHAKPDECDHEQLKQIAHLAGVRLQTAEATCAHPVSPGQDAKLSAGENDDQAEAQPVDANEPPQVDQASDCVAVTTTVHPVVDLSAACKTTARLSWSGLSLDASHHS